MIVSLSCDLKSYGKIPQNLRCFWTQQLPSLPVLSIKMLQADTGREFSASSGRGADEGKFRRAGVACLQRKRTRCEQRGGSARGCLRIAVAAVASLPVLPAFAQDFIVGIPGNETLIIRGPALQSADWFNLWAPGGGGTNVNGW